jgi:hypothetical protein
MGRRTNLCELRDLSRAAIDDGFCGFLETRLRELVGRTWGAGARGVFGAVAFVGAADAFDLRPGAFEVLAGAGENRELAGTDAAGIRFENAAGVVYAVGARACAVPRGVLRNRRTGVAFYDALEDRVGEVAAPSAVADVRGALQIVVDSVFEAGVSHAGRRVTVWLRRPLTTDESVAIERDLVVEWVGGVNRVTTVGLLGQGAGGAATDPSDYQVCAQGVTVRRNTDLRPLAAYAYLGAVVGGGAGNPPASVSTLDQIDVSDGIDPDLQEAYTAGRTITPAAAYGGAVKIASSDSGDALRALLHLDRKGATETSAVGLVSVAKLGDGIPLLALAPLATADGKLQEDEPGTTAAAGVVNLTRVGVDLVGAAVDAACDLALLSGFGTAANNRLLRVSARTATSVTLVELAGGAPAGWAAGEAGIVSLLRSRFAVGEVSAAAGVLAGAKVNAALDVLPRGANRALRAYALDNASLLLRVGGTANVGGDGLVKILDDGTVRIAGGGQVVLGDGAKIVGVALDVEPGLVSAAVVRGAKVVPTGAEDVALVGDSGTLRVLNETLSANAPVECADPTQDSHAVTRGRVAGTCRVRRVANQAIAHGTPTAVAFDTADWRTPAGMWDAAHPERLVAPYPGKYRATVRVTFAAHAGGARAVALLRSAGGGKPEDREVRLPLGADPDGVLVQTEVALAVGEYVWAEATQDSGGDLNALATGALERVVE